MNVKELRGDSCSVESVTYTRMIRSPSVAALNVNDVEQDGCKPQSKDGESG